MAYIYKNLNPLSNTTGDCAVRACAIATDKSWDYTYRELAKLGRLMGVMPDRGAVWGAYLRMNGFKRAIIPNSCPDCYRVKDFAKDNPRGTFVLGIDGSPGHVVTVIDGDYYDTWDSGEEIPTFFYYR